MTKKLVASLRSSLLLLLLMTLLLGVISPALVTAIAQIAFPFKANGSMGKHGSMLIGQEFSEPKYFWGRLSNASNGVSVASNIAPSNGLVLDPANKRIEQLQKADPDNHRKIPIDLITASGSGLDPHITLAGAYYQIPRIARARHQKEEDIKALVDKHRQSFLSAPYLNVLELNLALDGEE